jgi:hypothetical protein
MPNQFFFFFTTAILILYREQLMQGLYGAVI